ncbi:hypothetical protein BGZ99_004506 [Dissophora globulifera]|uniref:Uncharacterized protein n=1 Tax=Dissophora globulifera TaxID=979702 RepID=A0A9P6RK44_9FUNG|nr:hypothetical protein BGZ99_004506 [Dissophora globulifera]
MAPSAAIPIIVTSGVKAGVGPHYFPEETWSTNFTYSPSDTSTPVFTLPSRGNSTVVLANLYRAINARQNNWGHLSEMEFKVLSKATNTTICGVNTNYLGPVPCDHPTPGTISLTRQLYTFSNNTAPICEPTSDDCELMSMRTTLASWADYTTIFDTPWTVMYNDHQGNSIPIANITGASSTANSYRTAYIAERPTTLLVGYPESNGVSVMATFTTASFQTGLYDDFTLFMDSVHTIGSYKLVYASIFKALNASVSTPPLIGSTASDSVTLVYNTPSALSDNSSHITCVLYEVNLPRPEQQNQAVHRVSCRELRVAVMTNTGARPSPKYSRYTMMVMYNATAPNQVDQRQVLQSQYTESSLFGIESLDEVADQVVDLLNNITERLYPFAADYSAVVRELYYDNGISFEYWSVVFMGVLVAIVAVIFALDKKMNNKYSKMDVVKLIEKTTKTSSDESFMYPRWTLVQEGESCRVLLRGKMVHVVKTSEAEKLMDDDCN